MRRRAFRLLIGATLAGAILAGGAAAAAIALPPVMSSWKRHLRAIDAMLSGVRPYDAGIIRQTLELYIGDAVHVASSINGSSAAARDLRLRFRSFAADGREALGHAADPATLRPSLRQMTADCRSCHAAYN